jgi:hypothetical protein
MAERLPAGTANVVEHAADLKQRVPAEGVPKAEEISASQALDKVKAGLDRFLNGVGLS